MKIQGSTELRIVRGEKVWMKVAIFVPNLNPFELNPLIRAVAKDFGEFPAEWRSAGSRCHERVEL